MQDIKQQKNNAICQKCYNKRKPDEIECTNCGIIYQKNIDNMPYTHLLNNKLLSNNRFISFLLRKKYLFNISLIFATIFSIIITINIFLHYKNDTAYNMQSVISMIEHLSNTDKTNSAETWEDIIKGCNNLSDYNARILIAKTMIKLNEEPGIYRSLYYIDKYPSLEQLIDTNYYHKMYDYTYMKPSASMGWNNREIDASKKLRMVSTPLNIIYSICYGLISFFIISLSIQIAVFLGEKILTFIKSTISRSWYFFLKRISELSLALRGK